MAVNQNLSSSLIGRQENSNKIKEIAEALQNRSASGVVSL